MGFLTPNKMKLVFTILLTTLFFLFTALTLKCSLIGEICGSQVDEEGITQLIGGAQRVPLGCQQTCTPSEYNTALAQNILTKIVLPLLASYLLVSIYYSYLARRRMPD